MDQTQNDHFWCLGSAHETLKPGSDARHPPIHWSTDNKSTAHMKCSIEMADYICRPIQIAKLVILFFIAVNNLSPPVDSAMHAEAQILCAWGCDVKSNWVIRINSSIGASDVF